MNGFDLSNISGIYVGSTKYSAIYKGSSLIWPKPHDYSKDYFTIESLEDNNNIMFYQTGGANIYIYYSKDKINWTSYSSSWGSEMTTLNNGEKLYIKGNNLSFNSKNSWVNFSATKSIKVSGNIMSLLYKDDFVGKIDLRNQTYIFYSLFRQSSTIVDASNLILPAIDLTDSCYECMFYDCISLVSAPALLANKTAPYCCQNMFYNCTSLVNAPALPATTLDNSCYLGMFGSCTSLVNAPALPATTLANYCYKWMFSGCTSLVSAPELPALTTKTQCYYQMFNNCSRLSYVKAAFTNYVTNNTYNWLFGVASNGTFYKNSAATWTARNVSSVPSDWTIVTYTP